MRLPIVLQLLPLAAASVVRISSDYLVKEAIEAPRGWSKTGSPAPDTRISLRIALPRANVHILESHLNEISDPNHQRYGKHLTKEEIDALAGPHPESLSMVKGWLYSLNFDDEEIKPSPSNELLHLTTTISKAEQMLDTVFHEWTHAESDVARVRTTSWSLPQHLHGHVRFIQPTTMFESAYIPPSVTEVTDHIVNLKARDSEEDRDPCEKELSVSCVQKLYGLSGYTPLANINNSIAVTGFLDVPANRKDLQSFYAEQRPDAVSSDFKEVLINGGTNDQDGAAAWGKGKEHYPESNLDTQWAFGLSYPIPATFYSTAGEGQKLKQDPLQKSDASLPLDIWIDYLMNQPEVPWVISSSWGENEQSVPREYAEFICEGFMKLALRGVSLIFSSGDGGVGDGDEYESTQKCYSNDEEKKYKFIPQFPASCPWVTSVGMTMNFKEEIGGWAKINRGLLAQGGGSRASSGSGFSEYFSRPKWQDDAVSKYLAQMPEGQYDGFFNREGRAFPDVAAQGVFTPMYVNGERKIVFGTSISAPIFAAVIALVNDARLRNGQSTLGFLNPFLYSKGVDGMNDILKGQTYGCGTDGFSAAPGWDPVTGLGSPNFPKLKELALAFGAKETQDVPN